MLERKMGRININLRITPALCESLNVSIYKEKHKRGDVEPDVLGVKQGTRSRSQVRRSY